MARSNPRSSPESPIRYCSLSPSAGRQAGRQAERVPSQKGTRQRAGDPAMHALLLQHAGAVAVHDSATLLPKKAKRVHKQGVKQTDQLSQLLAPVPTNVTTAGAGLPAPRTSPVTTTIWYRAVPGWAAAAEPSVAAAAAAASLSCEALLARWRRSHPVCGAA